MLFAEAGLELVPKEIWRHPSVRASAERRGKRPGEMLLDISLHYHAAKRLRDFRKRGRPDIVHFCLLMALGSPLCKSGMLEPWVHTYGGAIIKVDREVRLPRNYNRFVGLIEQLLQEGRVPPGSESPLLEVVGRGLDLVLREVDPSKVFLLREEGEPLTPRRLAESLAREERPLVVIGAFQHGDFSEETREIADVEVRISEYVLDAWVATAEVVCALEGALGIHGDLLEDSGG